MTKRQVLSDISKMFDLLGWLSPVRMRLKQLMQKIWQAKLQWDDVLPKELSQSYLDWRDKLVTLRNIRLNRCVMKSGQNSSVKLHVFCDASEIGYAACVYVVTVDENNQHTSNLLTAKSKVAPLKSQSIPRLELCAALLGSNLIASVIECLEKMGIKIEAQYAWTDSTIVLNWLSSEPATWSVFVANRVAKIQENSSLSWNHVSTIENPADVASRNRSLKTRKSHQLDRKSVV